MKALAVLSICLLFMYSSCKKEENNNYPIIYPGSYFPVYPNSWWKYIDQDSVIIIDSTGPSYLLDRYKLLGDYNSTEYSDPCYVPNLNGSPIYYYDKIVSQVFPFGSSRWHILSEETGATFQKDWIDPRLSSPVEMVVVKGKYFNGTDSVLVQESHWTMNVSDAITTQEYAKNIGLIRQFTVDTITNDTMAMKVLLDYYVSFDSTSVAY
jgi:hypothetical protein